LCHLNDGNVTVTMAQDGVQRQAQTKTAPKQPSLSKSTVLAQLLPPPMRPQRDRARRQRWRLICHRASEAGLVISTPHVNDKTVC